MKVWVVTLQDGMGTIKLELCGDREKALTIGGDMMKEEFHGEDEGNACEGDDPSKFRVIEDYAKVPGLTLIVRARGPEDFFPGEAEVRIYEKEVL